MKQLARSSLSLAVAAALGLLGTVARADTVILDDKLTGNATSADKWWALGGACLTAGNSATPSTSVPACSSLTATGKPYEGKTLVGTLPAQLLWSHVRQSPWEFVRLADGEGQAVVVARRYPLREAKIQDL